VQESIRKSKLRRRLAFAAAAVLTLAAGGTAVAIETGGGGGDAPASVRASPRGSGEGHAHGLPTSNLRVLTEVQTRRLLAYASAVRTCLRDHGVAAAEPTKAERTITLATETRVGTGRLVRLVLPCAAQIGDPPPPASLQVVDSRTIALSVPKQCLLDPKIEA